MINKTPCIVFGISVVLCWSSYSSFARHTHAKPFPAQLPVTKPTERPLSAAMQRLYDVWSPQGDRANELYSNFKYSRLQGFSYENNASRRDPSKVLKINGTYYVWYTHRQTIRPPAGPKNATETIPSYDWDLAEIWYATSQDGFTWQEQGAAVKRLPRSLSENPVVGPRASGFVTGKDGEAGDIAVYRRWSQTPTSRKTSRSKPDRILRQAPRPQYGWRSVSTPDILAWGGKYYLYYQGFNEIPGLQGDRAAATVAEADSPDGPWRPSGRVVVDFGKEGEWDSNAIHDPYPLVYQGKIYLFYKGAPGKQGRDGTIVRAQGVAIAPHPLGPFKKSPLNPVLNSGHETCLWPWKEGIAAIVSLDGPEKNTVQFAPDGVNFQMMSLLQVPPIAPGPFVPDAFADNGDGRGLTWGLCHINPDGGGSVKYSILARFDCDLSRDVDRPLFKNNNLRFNEDTYFQARLRMWPGMRQDRKPQASEAGHGDSSRPQTNKSAAFPAKMPLAKPADRALSAAWSRMWDLWQPLEDRANELYSNFKYTPLQGLSREPNLSRRDPTKVVQVNGTYYVWYTCRRTQSPPVGLKDATETLPGTDWDLADIWYATSRDGVTWREQGIAVKRPARPQKGFRSICTPGILAWQGKYYLYFQAYSPMVGGQQYCPVRVAVAESPDGPWQHHSQPVILPGPPGSWDNIKINDPCPIVHEGKILIYYKGAPIERGSEFVLRMQGVALADHPLGPFAKSPLNPVLNSGHETCMWPWKSGVAALVALDGPEKNTIQYAPDGVNFRVVSRIQVPPIAPGPFVPDAFTDSGDGRGLTWGLAHINPDGGGAMNDSILVRFDCDLSRDVDWPLFKHNNLRHQASTYFQKRLKLPDDMRNLIKRERDKVDRETVLHGKP